MDKKPFPKIFITPLGAGRDVGRSCILLHMGGKTIMLDCGMHMGHSGEKRFPNFKYISEECPGKIVNCVLITHFHLDHCGALPYFTEVIGYDGPIYMSLPTKAIAPLLMEDMRKICSDIKGEGCMFSSQQVKDCIKKVTTVNVHQNVHVDKDIEIKAYYAGHVLGAVMFWIKVGDQTVVYTGDYNMTPDRHLGAAWIDKCRPDVLITESTYATTVRDSKRCRERDFLKKVHDHVENGAKILIPVFALGRAQEMCILLDTYWERMNLKVPIYFAAGLTEKANSYYKLFITWTNETVKKTFVDRNIFDFRHIKSFDKSYANNPGPMIVFATPGMLHAGLSLQLFKKWAPNEKNLLIMPGFCVRGTVGYQVVNGAKRIKFEDNNYVDVKLSVEYMSFSAHADSKGIMQLIQYCEPKNVLLVHGESSKMKYLREKIQSECHNIPCYMPRNGETTVIDTHFDIPIHLSTKLLKLVKGNYNSDELINLQPSASRIIHGVLVKCNNKFALLDIDDACRECGITRHIVRFTSSVKLYKIGPALEAAEKVYEYIKPRVENFNCQLMENIISIETFGKDCVIIRLEGDDDDYCAFVSWTNEDYELGAKVLEDLKRFDVCKEHS